MPHPPAVSVILFSDDAINRKPFGPMRTARLGSLRAGVQRLKTIGGTNLQAGMDAAAAEFRRYAGYRSADPMSTESRMVILTGGEVAKVLLPGGSSWCMVIVIRLCSYT